MMKVGILSVLPLFLQTDNFCSISFPTLNPLVFSCQGNFSLCLFLSFSPSVCLSLFLSVSLCLSLSCLSGWQSLYISISHQPRWHISRWFNNQNFFIYCTAFIVLPSNQFHCLLTGLQLRILLLTQQENYLDRKFDVLIFSKTFEIFLVKAISFIIRDSLLAKVTDSI